MNELSVTLDQLIKTGEKIVGTAKEMAICAELLINTAKDIQSVFSSGNQDLTINKVNEIPIIDVEETPNKPTTSVRTYSKEDVRGVLAEKSSAGHRKEVIALLKKYGATQLMQVDPTSYEALIEEAKEIGNG